MLHEDGTTQPALPNYGPGKEHSQDENLDSFDEKEPVVDGAILESGNKFNASDDFLEAKGDNSDPAYASIPLVVRELCDFDDDETLPVLTFRFYVLSGIFTALGAWLVQMGFFRTTYVPYSIYFVQIAALYFGKLLARILPTRTVGFGRFSFELNPGPFNIKEHVAIVLAANTGATNNLGDYVVAPLAVFYQTPMNGWLAILFMWSAVFIGFSLASFARVFLVENPVTLFPLTLQQVTVFRAMRNMGDGSKTARNQLRLFWWGILAFFLWEFLPEYAFPFVSSLAVMCWFTKNPTATFLSSGLGGAGLLNFTLDWSNIGSTAIYYPFFASTIVFVASVIGAWVLVPIGYFTGAWESDKYPIQSQTLRLDNGTTYPTSKLMNPDYTLNTELFDIIGPPRMSAQLRWNYFFSYAAYIGSFVSCALFQGPTIWKSFKAARSGDVLYNNKLTQMIRKYPQVPVWWNLALFFFPAIVILGLVVKKDILYMPIYSYFFALAFGVAIVIPMGYIYAISGYRVPVGYFNELFYGYLIDIGGSRHPVGSLAYRVISGQCWYEACSMLSDMKLGYYFHIPPRVTLFAQIWGILVGVPINYATILWICNTKADFLDGTAKDPNHQWTGQTVISLNNQGIAFALVGPKRLFSDSMYTILPYGFLAGAIAPFILYTLHRWKPTWRFDLWNIGIFASILENFYGNISNTFLTWYILACINHLWLKKHRYAFWKKYAYIFGAAADTGFNFALLIIFLAFSAFKVVTMPEWWGNNSTSVERCFPSS